MSFLIETLPHKEFKYIWGGGEWMKLNRKYSSPSVGSFVQIRCRPSRHVGDNSLSIGHDIHMYRQVDSCIYLPTGVCMVKLKTASPYGDLTNFII